ncbi:MAG: deoxyguanosinetriphosphate triphosphohydrolase, partial [Candidatus Margulisiibacteriota bacterium]
KGLNLCCEVINGIRNHTPDDPWPETLEGCVVRFADRIAYLKHDTDDAIRAKVLTKKRLPKKPMKVLGRKFLDRMVKDLVKNSREKQKLTMSKEVQEAMDELYKFMYKNVYTNRTAKSEETKVPEILRLLFLHYHYNHDFQKGIKQEHQLQNTVDFIAGMTDHYAINKFQELFVPTEWRAKR